MSTSTPEILPLVNEQDQVIGQHPRGSEVFAAGGIYRITAIWVYNSKGEVLVAKRLDTKKLFPGLWEVAAGGMVTICETYETNAYNEAQEEIGLQGYTFKEEKKFLLKETTNKFCQLYSCCVDQPLSYFSIQAEEVDCIEWMDFKALKKDVAQYPEKYVPRMPLFISHMDDLTHDQ